MPDTGLPLPFGPESRTGFELELLAPQGRTRRDLAFALAEGDPGRVRFGFKYYHRGDHYQDGKPISRLTPAFRVLEPDGRVLATLVDEPAVIREIQGGLPPRGPGLSGRTNDVRFAKWIERHCWSQEEDVRATLAPLTRVFEGSWVGEGDGAKLVDPYGHPLLELGSEQGDRDRVCEIVTPPLPRHERHDALERLLSAARGLGFVPPQVAAIHAHLDNGPWRSTPRLAALIRGMDDAFLQIREDVQTNPGCSKLGRMPEAAVRVAREAPPDCPFEVFAAALKVAGVVKHCDVNVLGAVEKFPVHPTIELRFLPMRMRASAALEDLERVESLLLGLARTVDGEAGRSRP